MTPSRSGYTFTPPSMTFSNLGANQAANFTATAVVVNSNLALKKPAAQTSTLGGYGPQLGRSSVG